MIYVSPFSWKHEMHIVQYLVQNTSQICFFFLHPPTVLVKIKIDSCKTTLSNYTYLTLIASSLPPIAPITGGQSSRA